MKSFELLRERAIEFYKHIELTWKEREVIQEEKFYENKVPTILFPKEAKVVLKELHCYDNLPNRYIGECQVEYFGDTFVFEVTTKLFENKLTVEQIEVYTPAGDGKGSLHHLLTKRM